MPSVLRTATALTCLTIGLSAPAMAQNINGDDLILSGEITQNGIGTNFFNGNYSSFNGSMCVGNSCTAVEANGLGNPSIKLKWSEPQILMDDTSNVAFNDRDWRIGPARNGAARVFIIMDEGNDWNDSNEVIPFSIVGGAPENAFWLAADGDLGLGTSIPLSDLHIVGAADASMRLETVTDPQSWELYSAADLGIIDRTNLTEPFRIEPGAPTDTMHLGNNGNVGIGTDTPSAPLHVQRTDNTARLLIEDTGSSGAQELFKLSNNGGSYFTFENAAAGTTWFFTHENAAPNRFIIADGVADGPEMTLTADGDLTIPGQLFTGGSCAAGCDRVFDEDYPLPTIAEQAKMMRANKHLPAVGPTPEDGPFNITAMTGGMLNELEKAHLYIAELEERDRVRAAENAAQDARIARLEALVADLAAR
ncbi:hypothetical protein ACOXXX_18340 [Thalassococcus sp. BH17M4-6]|uniref:hypothetical protein n=1 Tax=Thalassococcus sp. BH17M4-6 TaxID=3413148 RepID=UPI003BD20D36